MIGFPSFWMIASIGIEFWQTTGWASRLASADYLCDTPQAVASLLGT